MTVALMYHHISPLAGPHTVSPEKFREHLSYFRSRGIRTLSLAEFSALKENSASSPRTKTVLLTFDDAWLDNWVYALPILEEFGARAVFFAVTSWPQNGIAREELRGDLEWEPPSHTACMSLAGSPKGDDVSMRWSELAAARDTGLVDISSHSHSHGAWWDVSGGWDQKMSALESDLEMSREAISEYLGEVPRNFCWPKGFVSRRAMDIAWQKGFHTQFSTLRGGNLRSRERLVRRIDAENKGQDWLRNRLAVYSNPILSEVLGLVHQNLHRSRMARRFPDAPPNEFSFPVLKPI